MAGKIECRTSPEINASIYYDGRKQTNPTPIRLTGVPAGSHTIKFELDGYESQTKTVVVSDDTTSYSTVTLKLIAPPPEEKGKIRCITTPSDADVYFNGRKQVNKTPVTLTGITPNKFHTIKFTKSDFLDSSDQWSVKPGQTIVAEKILIPVMQPGYINAISDLPDVTVKMIIEGKTYSYPAPHKFGAPAGKQVVFFSKLDHKQVEHSVTVEPRQTVTLKGNPIPIVADTTLILNTLPSEVSEGDKITLSGTLQSKDGKPVVGQIHFYDKDTLSADDELFENNKPLVAMSSSSTGKYSATWTVKKVDSESLIERGTSGAQIYAAFDGTSTHNKSKSTIRNITLKEIPKEGQLRITTRPPGADVYIDGEKQEIGTSAEEFSVIKKLPFGKYTIKTEIKGFDPMEEEVEIKEGPYETIVNHIYEGAKNLCGVLGFDTTELGCVRAILTLPVDLFTPLADAYVIKNHKSMYTGEPETPTKWTYLFFLLGFIPLAGAVTSTVGKAGVKLTAEGAKLAQLAKADSKLVEILMDSRALSKLPHMSEFNIDYLFRAIDNKNYDTVRRLLDTTVETEKMAYANWHDEFVENIGKILDPKATDDVVKYMDDAVKISEKTYPALKTFDVDTSVSNTLFKILSSSLTNKQLQEILIDKQFVNKIIVASPEEASTLLNLIKLNKLDEFTSVLEKMDDAPLNEITKSEIANEILKILDPSGIHVDATKIIRQSIGLPYGRGEFWQTFFLTRYLDEEENLAQYMDGVVREVLDVGRTDTNIVSEFVRTIINSNEIDPLIKKLALSNIKEAKLFSQYLKSMKEIVQSENKLGTHFDDVITKLSDGFYKGVHTDNAYPITNVLEGLFDTQGNLKNIDEIVQFLTKAVPDLFTKFSDMLANITSGAKKSITKTEADEFLQMSTDSPDITRDILKTVDSDTIVKNLDNIKTDESSAISTFIKSTDKIDTRSEDFTKIASQSSAAIKAALNDAPQILPKMGEATDDINNIFEKHATIKKSANAAGIKIDYNIIEAIEDAWKSIKNSPLQTPSITANFIKGYLKGIWKFMKAHPAFAIVTAIGVTTMSLWFNSDNVPFYGYMWLEHKGLKPGTRSFIANQQLDGLKTQAFLSKDFCEMADYENLRTALDLYKEKLNTLETYINENRDTLDSEGFLGIAEDGLESYTLMLETDEMLKCLPAEIPIPESGIIKDVFVSEIIDGDTIECRKDDETFRVRMVGINTPDKGPAGYSTACSESKNAETNTVWCSKDTYTKSIKQLWDLTDDKVISLKVDPKREKDIHGRYVALLINKAGVEINLEMIKSGYACYYHRKDFEETGLFNHDEYIAARNTARDAKLGIWALFELDVDIGYADFTTIPTGAQIYINNEYLTTTKKSNASFEVGTYSVRFVKEGFHPCEQEFEIKKDEKTPVTCTLKEITEEEKKLEGYALFRAFRKSSSSDLVSISADVWDETSFLFRTSPSSSRALQPGDYNITFKRYNYEDKSTTFTIETDKTITVDETLTELPKDEIDDPDEPDEPFGLVDFMSTPSVAKIFVNESYIGTTKKSGFKLSEGSYSVMFEKEGYEACTKQLLVIVDERVPVECILTESLLPPTEEGYPEVPYFPTTPSRRKLPPSTYEITPMSAPPTKREPEVEPWEEFKVPMKVLFLNIGKEVAKQTIISTAGQKFIDKHCDLEFEWESEDQDTVELGVDDNDCATLDDVEELTETIEPDKVPEGTKIIYLLWNADEPKCVSYTGFTGGMDDLLFDAMLCSSPTSKSKPEFTATTGKLKNDNLKIKYEGSLTIIIQICEALHELYEKTKSDDAEKLPEFDEEFCEKNIMDDRPNAKCVAEWLTKFNNALPNEIKERSP